MSNANAGRIGTTGGRDRRLGVAFAVLLVVLSVVGMLLGRSTSAHAATATHVNLGTAGAFAVLAGSTITNTGSTTLNGSAGLHPGTSVTGFDSVTFTSGQLHVANSTAASAKNALVTAYNNAAGQSPTTIATELGGKLLPGGVYNSSSGTFGLSGTLRLDAQGDPDTVWVFQTASTLITGVNSSVVLLNGADACNVFWKVGSSATLGTGTSFAGNILALTSITLNNSATIIKGRALARNGAVTMERNTIERAVCSTQVTPPPSPSPSPSPSPTVSPTPSPTPSPTTSPAPVDTVSPSPIAVPVDTDTPTDTTGSPDAPTDTTGSPDEPDEPDAAAPPSSGTPQVPAVPSGPVPAGDGSMASATGGAPAVLLLPFLAALVLLATWRRRNA